MGAMRAILALSLCLGLLLPGAAPASAAAIVVNSLSDVIADDGNCTLREAIRAANLDQAVGGCAAGSGEDTITLPAGTITLAIPGHMEDAALTGDLDILKTLTITGAGRDLTIIDGDRLDRVFDVQGEEIAFHLSDLTVRGGYPTAEGWPEDEPMFGWGGGARVTYIFTTMTVTRVRFTENLVDQAEDGHGAAIYSGGPLEVRDSIFNNNESAVTGGAITSDRNLLVQHTSFIDNYGYGGAAIEFRYNLGNSGGRLEHVDFSGHFCGPTSGGVIDIGERLDVEIVDFVIETSDCQAETIQNYGNLTLINGRFFDNNASEGVINHHFGRLVVRGVQFDSNYAPGVVHITGGDAQIDRVHFDDTLGAGLWIEGGVTQLTNSTVSSGEGGILVNRGALKLESVTLANLQGELAALEVTGGQVIVHNTLIANNRDPAGTPVDCKLSPGSTVSAGYNLIGVSDGCGWKNATGDLVGTRAAPLNPLLGPLASGPGGTKTQPPLPGSPAIDAAEPDLCPEVDQRGVTRPQHMRCDIGAHEVDAASLMMYHIYMPRVASP